MLTSVMKFSFSFIIYLALLLNFLAHNQAQSHNTSTDKESLLSFKSLITSDPHGVLHSWSPNTSSCTWYGVLCNPTNHRVTHVTLGGFSLAGTLSPHITNLSFLHIIDLNHNQLSGNIPVNLHRLFRLQILNLSSNNFQGSIPSSLSACHGLQIIDLTENQLEGTIPFELGNLSKLQRLILRQNKLSGSIPYSLGNISSLTHLKLYSNNLKGPIPPELGRLSRLVELEFSVNNISDSIPTEIYNLTSLTELSLAENNIYGQLPSNLFSTLPNLMFVIVGGNLLHGKIPSSLSNASNLLTLDMSDNQFSGHVPLLWKLSKIWSVNLETNQLTSEGFQGGNGLNFISSLTNSSQLRIFSMVNNHLTGQLPSSIGNLSIQLSRFHFGRNQLSGEIPEEVGNLGNLIGLVLAWNFFTGEIPSSIGNLAKLQTLDLNNNLLSGLVPETFGNLTQLSEMSMAANKLTGQIPSSLSNCQHLQYLDLSANGLSGNIPKEIFSITSLEIILNMSVNNLTGTLPSEIGNLKMVQSIDIYKNRLSGSIPSTIGDCSNLQVLDMSINYFQGQIPSSLARLKGIEYLNLSFNELSSTIPSSLEGLVYLEDLDLSSNNLQGEVPKGGIFLNSSVIYLSRNPNLCGGVAEFELPRCSHPKTRLSHKAKKILIAGLFAGSTTLCIAIVFIFLVSYRKIKRKKKKHETNVISFDGPHRLYSYYDLKSATQDFNGANLIGQGSFGSVYKGLMRDGSCVAVKVFDMDQRGALKSFLAECEAFRNVRHRNLVKLLSACSNPSFKAMVLEFMPNGSLETWLHNKNDSERIGLSLTQRMDMLIDVAAAMEYLHHGCETPIVHCDLKPSNILLDKDMIVHIADFGLARILGVHSQSASSRNTIDLKGSIGYIAPEYGSGADVSTKGDVYSYGVVLLEMFTGRRPTEEMFSGDLNLQRWVEDKVPYEVSIIVDEKLMESHEDGKVDQLIISVLKTGLACVNKSPEDRPDMNHVCGSLKKARTLLFHHSSS